MALLCIGLDIFGSIDGFEHCVFKEFHGHVLWNVGGDCTINLIGCGFPIGVTDGKVSFFTGAVLADGGAGGDTAKLAVVAGSKDVGIDATCKVITFVLPENFGYCWCYFYAVARSLRL